MSPPPLVKAELWPLKEPNGQGSGGAKRLVVDDARPKVVVQFNPASLKITRRGNTDRGGVTTRTEHRQSPSAEPATLTFDLEFDTAEGGDDGQAQDVREKTKPVRQFIEPPDTNTGEAPPRVRFMWGTFIFDGIVSHITEDLDYFSADGTALRAKLSLEITEQDLKFEQDAKGAGARGASNATPPGGGPVQAGPGAPPAANPAQSAAAQAGESVQQLLTRLGADPSGWRTAMTGLGSPLALAAGQEVLLGAAVAARGGIGVSAGFAVQAGTSAAASPAGALGAGFAVQAGTSAAASPAGAPGEGATAAATVTGAPAVVVAADGSPQTAAGLALAAGGGISPSLSTFLSAEAGASAAQARAAFDVPAASLTVTPAIDPRALSYGRSIPLRARADPASVAGTMAGGQRSVTARAAAGQVPTATRAGQAPWEQLPPSRPGQTSASASQRCGDAAAGMMRWTPGR